MPGIYNRNPEILKVPCVPRGKRSAARERNTGDLRVAEIHWPTGFLSLRRERRCFRGSGSIECQHSIFEVFRQQPREGGFQSLPAFPPGQHRQTETRLKKGDAGDPDGICLLAIEPLNDRQFRRLPHQC